MVFAINSLLWSRSQKPRQWSSASRTDEGAAIEATWIFNIGILEHLGAILRVLARLLLQPCNPKAHYREENHAIQKKKLAWCCVIWIYVVRSVIILSSRNPIDNWKPVSTGRQKLQGGSTNPKEVTGLPLQTGEIPLTRKGWRVQLFCETSPGHQFSKSFARLVLRCIDAARNDQIVIEKRSPISTLLVVYTLFIDFRSLIFKN